MDDFDKAVILIGLLVVHALWSHLSKRQLRRALAYQKLRNAKAFAEVNKLKPYSRPGNAR